MRRPFMAYAFILWSLAVGACLAAPSEDRNAAPKVLVLYRQPIPVMVAPGVHGFLNSVETGEKNPVARGFFLQATSDEKPYPAGKANGYLARYPDLQVGDIVPLFHDVYRVQSAAPKSNSGDASVGFLRLPGAGFEVPEGVSVGNGIYVFPFGVGGGGSLHGIPFQAYFEDDAAKIVIRARTRRLPTGIETVERERVQQVKEGGQIEFDGFVYKVVKIVPPDEKSRVIGWLELDPHKEK